MATVILQAGFARQHTDGQTRLSVTAANFHELVEQLDQRFPGFSETLAGGTAVAIDGEIYQTPLLELIGPDSEVHFLPMIGGGAAV